MDDLVSQKIRWLKSAEQIIRHDRESIMWRKGSWWLKSTGRITPLEQEAFRAELKVIKVRFYFEPFSDGYTN